MTPLGSEGEDEVGLWSLEPQDCQESLDKTSLTPSEEMEEPGSPARSTRPHSLSPGGRTYWVQVEPEAEGAEDNGAASIADKDGEHDPLRMYCKSAVPKTTGISHYCAIVGDFQNKTSFRPSSVSIGVCMTFDLLFRNTDIKIDMTGFVLN